MKFRRGQAAWIIVEALHQLGRIAMLLVLLAIYLVSSLVLRSPLGGLYVITPIVLWAGGAGGRRAGGGAGPPGGL